MLNKAATQPAGKDRIKADVALKEPQAVGKLSGSMAALMEMTVGVFCG